MSELKAFPLTWPPGWQRMPAHLRKRAAFGIKRAGDYGPRLVELSVADAVVRVLTELGRLNVPRDDVLISSDLRLRLDGLPRSDQAAPADAGVAVYWLAPGRRRRCMAVDRYDRVADNLAAIAATLEAMRAIERHGGAAILDRAFTGFAALPPPEGGPAPWWTVLELEPLATREQIIEAHRRLAMRHHPDRGGDASLMARVNAARDAALGSFGRPS